MNVRRHHVTRTITSKWTNHDRTCRIPHTPYKKGRQWPHERFTPTGEHIRKNAAFSNVHNYASKEYRKTERSKNMKVKPFVRRCVLPLMLHICVEKEEGNRTAGRVHKPVVKEGQTLSPSADIPKPGMVTPEEHSLPFAACIFSCTTRPGRSSPRQQS